MKSFKLTTKNPMKKFSFQTKDSFLKLIKLSAIFSENFPITKQISEFISNFHLQITLSYLVYEDENITDDRIKEFPFFFSQELKQIQAIFKMNKTIKTEEFILGFNRDVKFYNELTIKLEGAAYQKEELNVTIFYDDYLINIQNE